MNSGKYTVDRFEGEQVVLLYRTDETVEFVMNKTDFPEETKEGDILFLEFNEDGGVTSTRILKEETEEARQAARNLLNKLKNK